MKAIAINMPVMREAEGHSYWPGATSPATLLALALLLTAFVCAYRYPAMKADEAIQRIEAINELSDQSVKRTQAALSRLQVLIADQPEWLRQVAAEQTSNLQEQLSLVNPLSKEQVLQKAVAQQERYNQAQQLIEESPFKGLTKQQVPLSVEGKTYLSALEVKRPSRFDYQRLSDGVFDALPVLQEGFKLQVQTENLVHRLDLQLNGDKASALGPAAATAQQATDYPSELPPKFVQSRPSPAASVDTLNDAIRQAERNAKRQQRQTELEARNLARLAEREALRTEQQVQRGQQKAQRLAVQRQRVDERQATAALEATRRADLRVAAARRQAVAAAEAKQKECTATLVARARCAAQGYNPLTGTKY